jgi:SOS response regulatory protein OraA/RecX
MKITAISYQVKNPDRVSIFIDSKYSFSLTLDQLLTEKLKKDIELTEDDIKRLKKLSADGKLRARALEWLLNRPHSEKEFREYLYKKKLEKDQIDEFVDFFRAKKYLSDELFADWYSDLAMRKQKSNKQIVAELRAKGLSPLTIQSKVTDILSVVSEKEALKEIVNKLSSRPKYASNPLKFKRYLLSKGFRWEQISEVLAEKALED